jgi:glycosyltransferase involved in cell wall biosynthesis
MSRELISIIIPTFNRALDLKRALQSVIDQTYPIWEVIVIDNFSEDCTEEIIRSFDDRRINYYKFFNDGNIARSRNFGIDRAIGEYIAFLDSDDWWKPEKLEVTMRFFASDVDFAYHDMFIVKKLDRLFYRKTSSRKLKNAPFFNLLSHGNTICNSSVVVRSRVLDYIRGLPEDSELNACGDFDAWLQLSKVTNAFLKVPYTLGYYWLGGGNFSSNNGTILCLRALLSKYEQDLDRLGFNKLYWVDYIIGVRNYKLKNYRMSAIHFKSVNSQNPPLSIRVKAVLIYIFVVFHLLLYNRKELYTVLKLLL